MPVPPRSTGGRWSLAALIATLIPLALVVWLPVTSEVSVDSSGLTTETQRTLLASEGASVLGVLAVPVLVAAIPLAASGTRRSRQARIGAAIALGLCVVLGAMTVGVAYVPATMLAIVAASRDQRPTLPEARPEPLRPGY